MCIENEVIEKRNLSTVQKENIRDDLEDIRDEMRVLMTTIDSYMSDGFTTLELFDEKLHKTWWSLQEFHDVLKKVVTVG